MIKLISAVVLAISLTGCYQVVNSWDIERATKICGGLENVVAIAAHINGTEAVQCKTGPTRNLKSAYE